MLPVIENEMDRIMERNMYIYPMGKEIGTLTANHGMEMGS
jgi:hypothetical protein